MKIRSGFVSNSSTSSFILITDDETMLKTKLTPYERAVANTIMQRRNILGRELWVIMLYMGQGGDGALDRLDVDYDGPVDDPEEDFYGYSGAFERIVKKLKANGQVFEESIYN